MIVYPLWKSNAQVSDDYSTAPSAPSALEPGLQRQRVVSESRM